MVLMSDATLNETQGNYRLVCDLMGSGVWMLRSDMVVQSPTLCSSFLVHFWNDGRVVIQTTSHPIQFDAPDDDLRMLAEWCKMNGWGIPEVCADMLLGQTDFLFWLRMYRANFVGSKQLKDYDEEEARRFSKLMRQESQDAD